MRVYYKTYYRCIEDEDWLLFDRFGDEVKFIAYSITFNGVLEDDGTYSAIPAWFNQTSSSYPLSDVFWAMTWSSSHVDGDHFRFSWTIVDKLTEEEIEYIVEIHLTSTCSITLGRECDPLAVLYWLTREGGWTYFPFNGKRTFRTDIPDGKTYVNGEYVKRNSSRKGVYQGELLTTGSIPESALTLLESLKESIQVYYVENVFLDGFQNYKPVILQDGDFIKKKTGDKIFDVSVKFFYAEEVQMQTQ